MITTQTYLIHGLLCRPWIMAYLKRGLRRRGWVVDVFSYPSRRLPFEQNVILLQRFLQQSTAENINIVAHSLGGLLTLAAQPDERVKKIVLLGSPVNGSAYGQYFTRQRWGKWLLGNNAALWHHLPKIAVPKHVQIGAIAGNYAPFYSQGLLSKLTAPHDGIVTVAETKLAGDSVAIS